MNARDSAGDLGTSLLRDVLREEFLREGKGERHRLLVVLAAYIGVLKPLPGGVAGLGDQSQELLEIIPLQSLDLVQDPLVLVEEMQRTHDSPVAGLGTYRRQIIGQILRIDLGNERLYRHGIEIYDILEYEHLRAYLVRQLRVAQI